MTASSIGGPAGMRPAMRPDNNPQGVGVPDAPVGNLPNPAVILERSRQRFPDIPIQVLQGRLAHSPAGLERLTRQMRDHERTAGGAEIPIAIGRSDKPRIAYMPTTGVAGPDIPGKIQRYVIEGQEIYDRVMAGNFRETPSKHDVTRIMWFLQALGSAKAAESAGQTGLATYTDGAMCVSDPDGRLETFLRNANSYRRSSSHFTEYQALGGDFAPRGVDVRNTETPNERKTVLFARLPKNNEVPENGPPGMGDTRMLFIKMESHGCRGLTPRGSGTPREPGTPVEIWKGIKRFFANARDLFMHGTGWLRSIAQRRGIVDAGGPNNKERIPADVKNSWNAMRQSVLTSPLSEGDRTALMAALERGRPLGDSGGIKLMLPNLDAAIALLEPREDQGDGSSGLLALLRDLRTMLQTHGDHSALRTGNEILLTREEMTVGEVTALHSWDGRSRVAREYTMAREDQEIVLAGMRYRLANIDSVDGVRTFLADAARSQYRVTNREGSKMNEFYQNADAARLAVEKLADGDERLAKVLMSFCHQGLPSDIFAPMTDQARLRDGLVVLPGHPGRFSIIRATRPTAPLPDGAKQYWISHDIRCTPQVMGLDGSRPEWASAQLITSLWLTLTVDESGAMEIDFLEPPKFSYQIQP